MDTDTIKIQANVEQNLAERVNNTIASFGLDPATLINMVYHTIDNTGKLPVQTELTAEQQNTLSLDRATENASMVQNNDQ